MRNVFALVLALVTLTGTLPLQPSQEEVLLPILMYHEIRDSKLGKDVVSPAELESDLRYLREQGYQTVKMADLVAFVYQGKPLPEKPILLSFDDGCLSNYVNALPLLRRYESSMVLSIIGHSTDEFSEYPENNLHYAHITWNQLRELLGSGLVEVQNHSYDLHQYQANGKGCLPRAGENRAAFERRLTEDVTRLQETLFAQTGCVPNTFTYPYGLYTPETEGILRELGFLATLSCDFGVNVLSRDPDCLFGMKRICRSHGADLGELLAHAKAYQKASGKGG